MDFTMAIGRESKMSFGCHWWSLVVILSHLLYAAKW